MASRVCAIIGSGYISVCDVSLVNSAGEVGDGSACFISYLLNQNNVIATNNLQRDNEMEQGESHKISQCIYIASSQAKVALRPMLYIRSRLALYGRRG